MRRIGNLRFEIHTDATSARMELGGEFDIACADEAGRALQELLREGVGAIVLDLSGLEFMDSTGIKFLVEARESARELGIAVSLIPGGDAVQRVLEVSGVGALFDP